MNLYFVPFVLIKTRHTTAIKQLDKKQLGAILSNQNITGQHFPEGRVIVDSVPYRPRKSNAELIITERTIIVISGEGTNRLLLTFGNNFRAYVGLFYNLEIYGCTESLGAHLLKRFMNISKHMTLEKLCIRIYSREGTVWQVITNIINDFKFQKIQLSWPGLLCCQIPHHTESQSNKL